VGFARRNNPITKVFEDERIPRDVIDVIMYEVPKNNWAHGGKLHSESD
jgi:phenylpyruvate tautomerase PptA (4-oxalocrotonate tautomerase family)